MVSILGATLSHLPLKYTCLIQLTEPGMSTLALVAQSNYEVCDLIVGIFNSMTILANESYQELSCLVNNRKSLMCSSQVHNCTQFLGFALWDHVLSKIIIT